MKIVLSITFLILFSTILHSQNFANLIRMANGGDVGAQYSLGLMYYTGDGVPRNYKLALQWYTKAAEKGDTASQFHLGKMYDNGDGVPEDDELAVKWYTKAANRGDAASQFNLALMLHAGEGVSKDFNLAARCFKKAAEQGLEDAQFNLGIMYLKGEGVIEDMVTAYAWLSNSKANGYDAGKVLDPLKEKMTREQISAGQKMAKELFQKIENRENKGPFYWFD